MKLQFLSVKLFALSLTAIIASFAVGCGPQFQASSALAPTPPPATSDPMTAADMRSFEAAQENLPVTETALQSDLERGALLEDLTEQKPKYTDAQIADDAEKVYQKHKMKRRPAPRANPEERSDEEVRKELTQQDPAPSMTAPMEPEPTAQTPTKTAPVAPSATVPPKPAKRAPPVPEPFRTAEPETPAVSAAPTTAKTPPVKRTSPAQIRPRPKRPEPSLRSEFCDSLSVTSTSAKTDLSALYNSTSALAPTMPSADLAAAATSQDKKNRFVCSLLPAAIRMNEEVFKQRVEVLRLQAKEKKGTALTADDKEWLSDMRKAYRVADNGSYEELLKRVDIIPLPLLLAQAAIESGWGTSRATVDLKNIFGIHAVAGQPCKTGYDVGNACVRVFESIPRGVSAYIQFINSGTYYSKFRDLRAKMREAGESIDSIKLLGTLGSYNETPVQYIRNVREIMTGSNKLTQFKFEEDAVETSN